MRIAIVDYYVTPTNPIGSCHLRLLRELCDEHDFTVFAVRFENPRPDRIRWVRVPAPTRPLAALFIAYHLMASLMYLWYRLIKRESWDLVQSVESNFVFGGLAYSHFCHRAFLKQHAPSRADLRGHLRWLDHKLHAIMEPVVYRLVKQVVVPSHGLARELAAEFPRLDGKIEIVSNAIDLDRMQSPSDFDRQAEREKLGFGPDAIVLTFVALGQFERKGLPLILDALQHLNDSRVRLMAVGGEVDLIDSYRSRTRAMGIDERVTFAGMQRDVRPYLWIADGFILASSYEVFPLVALEAAAAGLPLLVSKLYGVEEFIVEGVNGLILERTSADVARGIAALAKLAPERRREMGEGAKLAISRFSTAAFAEGWRRVYGLW